MLLDTSRHRPLNISRAPRITVLWRLGVKSASRLGWGIADQAVSSITNFAVVILVAHSLGAVQFGAFSLAYLAYGFALNLSRGLASYPLQVRFSGADLPTWRRAVASSTGTALVTGIATGICMLGVAVLLTGDTRAAFLALGLTLPGLLLQDSWRYAFFVLGRGAKAFLNDSVWATAQIPAMLLLRTSGDHSVFWFIIAWGGAAAVAAAVGPLQAKVVPSLPSVTHWLSQQRDLGPRYVASDLVGSIPIQVRSSVVGGMLGLAVVGYIQAAGTLMGPFMVIFYGIGLVTVPEAVRILHRSPRRLPVYCVAVACGLATAALIWGGLLLLALPRGLGNLVLGHIWRPTYVLVLPQTLAAVGQTFSSGASTGLTALGAARRSLRAATTSALAFLVCGVAGPFLGGAIGTMIGAAIAAWLGALVYWWELRGAAREHGIFQAGPRTRHGRGRHRAATRSVAHSRQSTEGRHRQLNGSAPWLEQDSSPRRDSQLVESEAADVAQMTWMQLIEHIDRIQHPERVGSQCHGL
jgi:O-antigen/teichoic acid export membrane protein